MRAAAIICKKKQIELFVSDRRYDIRKLGAERGFESGRSLEARRRVQDNKRLAPLGRTTRIDCMSKIEIRVVKGDMARNDGRLDA